MFLKESLFAVLSRRDRMNKSVDTMVYILPKTLASLRTAGIDFT